jgi:hypothetical protein
MRREQFTLEAGYLIARVVNSRPAATGFKLAAKAIDRRL